MGGMVRLPLFPYFVCFYVCRSMRSSPVKSTPENGLLLIRFSSWTFASRKYRIFNASFTLKYPHRKFLKRSHMEKRQLSTPVKVNYK